MATLTYDTTYIPITPKGKLSLRKKDVQDFMKRLRYYSGVNDIKYFAVGEYGSKRWRPHYHIILYNVDYEDIYRAWMDEGAIMGDIKFIPVCEASVYYTLKYMCKPGRVPENRHDDREPEFRLMSKGLGLSYLQSKWPNWHASDLENRCYLVVDGNKKIAMPRYYRDRIYLEEEKLSVTAASMARAADLTGKKFDKDPNYWRNERERVKAEFRKANYHSKNRQSL